MGQWVRAVMAVGGGSIAMFACAGLMLDVYRSNRFDGRAGLWRSALQPSLGSACRVIPRSGRRSLSRRLLPILLRRIGPTEQHGGVNQQAFDRAEVCAVRQYLPRHFGLVGDEAVDAQ